MPRTAQIDDTVGVEVRALGAECIGEGGPGEDEIECREPLGDRSEVVARTLDGAREAVEDPLDLGPLGELSFAHSVVRLEDLQRLD